MKQKIIIAGGSGFLGQVLETYFRKTHEVKILTRNPKKENHIFWDAHSIAQWQQELENTYAFINLAGKSVNCRYNNINKALICSSRVNATRVLGRAVNLCENPPKVWIRPNLHTHETNGEVQPIATSPGVALLFSMISLGLDPMGNVAANLARSRLHRKMARTAIM